MLDCKSFLNGMKLSFLRNMSESAAAQLIIAWPCNCTDCICCIYICGMWCDNNVAHAADDPATSMPIRALVDLVGVAQGAQAVADICRHCL